MDSDQLKPAGRGPHASGEDVIDAKADGGLVEIEGSVEETTAPTGELRLVPGCRPFRLEDIDELCDARAVLLQVAATADHATVCRMLDVALTHLEELEAEAWDGYMAVEATAGGLTPEAERMARAVWRRRTP